MGFAASSPDKARNFTIKETPIENFRPLKVRVIGAGYSGIYLGIRIPQKLRNIDLKIYEKNEGVGGTWWENRYPGCACDIPAHSYQYSFEPNPRWSGFYAPSAEIRSYLEHVSQKYGVPRFLELSHKVVECTWLEKTKKWKLVVEKTATGETFEEEADFVISCRGNLNEISWPNIPGFKNFEGELMHSAAWNDSYDFENKRIGVIGGGSSSIQIVPQLQKVNGAKVACFMRNKSWISNPFGEVVMQKLGLDPNVLEFTEEQKQEFERNPKAYLKFRKTIEADGNAIHGLTSDRSSKDAAAFVEILKDVTAKTLSTKSEILSSFTPAFGIGCRRLTPGVGFLEALVQENVDFIPDPIARVNGSGLELENGKQVDIDVLVCATGFDTSHVPPFEVTGKNGSTLRQKFQPFPQTYLSVAVDDFPNFFMMLGPNAGIGAGSLTLILEGQGDYIIKCLRKLQKEDYVCMVPRSARVRDFSDYIGEYFKRTVYMDACESWYKSEGGKSKGKEERVTALWPGSSLHMLETLRAPRWEDYEFESSEENRLRWLGNGWSICLMEGQGDPSWYINPDVVDVPPAGTPESDPQNSIRVFSH